MTSNIIQTDRLSYAYGEIRTLLVGLSRSHGKTIFIISAGHLLFQRSINQLRAAQDVRASGISNDPSYAVGHCYGNMAMVRIFHQNGLK